MQSDVVSLARKLIAFNTIREEGSEDRCLDFIEGLLDQAGFTVWRVPLGPGRGSLVARLHPKARGPALCFAGHIDTVPLGAKDWSVPPFDGEVRDGLLYGRGAVDMKGGVAAFLTAAIRRAGDLGSDQDLVLHCYGGEETGCEGSFSVATHAGHIARIGAAVVAEPTSNRLLVGHKGALWLKGTARGRTAHAAMHHEGENALVKAVRAVTAIEDLDIVAEDPHMGGFSKVVSTFHSGLNVNSVPDSASFTVDMRTVPGQESTAISSMIKKAIGNLADVEVLLDVPPFWTDPADPWVGRVWSMLRQGAGREEPFRVRTVQFFTDAAALRQVLPHVPMVILGPGDPEKAHSTDEACPVRELDEACGFYENIIRDWYRPESCGTGRLGEGM